MKQVICRSNPALPFAVAVAAALALLWVVPQTAPAAQDEVHFDPDSPAGKEYALPVDQAREEAAGGASDGPSGEKAPLFGAGVSRSGSPPGSSSASGDTGGARGDSGGQPAERRSNGQPSAEPRAGNAGPSPEKAHHAVLAAADDGYPLARGVGLAAAVVLLGGAIALALQGARRLAPR